MTGKPGEREADMSITGGSPDWLVLGAVALVSAALNSLRQCIEDPEDSGVTWERPEVTVEYKLTAGEWDWEERRLMSSGAEDGRVSMSGLNGSARRRLRMSAQET